MLFRELPIDVGIIKALQDQKLLQTTPIQEKTIPLLLDGSDLIGCAMTGSGKSAAFVIPILDKLSRSQNMDNNSHNNSPKIRALVLVPTRELASQIGEIFINYGRYLEVKTQTIYGGISIQRQKKALTNHPDIVVATPGRLIDLIGQGYVGLECLEMFVIDEVDRTLDMGMRRDVQSIIRLLPRQRQNIFFSATLTEEVEKFIDRISEEVIHISIQDNSDADSKTIEKVYFVDDPHKISLLLELLNRNTMKSVLVFTNTQYQADKIRKILIKYAIASKSIHGNKTQQARESILEMFKSRKIRVLIATDIAARGIDITNVSHVINFDLPDSPKTYVHRIGRTSRAGRSGRAISFCSLYEVERLQAIEAEIGHSINEAVNHKYLPQFMVFIRKR